MSHRTWLSSQGLLWPLAQRQLVPMLQVSAEARRSIALFPGGSTSSQLLYFCIIVCLAVAACGGAEHTGNRAWLWGQGHTKAPGTCQSLSCCS